MGEAARPGTVCAYNYCIECNEFRPCVVGRNCRHPDARKCDICKYRPEKCGACGWNPSVSEDRKRRIRKQLEQEAGHEHD